VTVTGVLVGLPLLLGVLVTFAVAVTGPVVVLYRATLGNWAAAGDAGLLTIMSWVVVALVISVNRR
jgi:hypothetical protein